MAHSVKLLVLFITIVSMETCLCAMHFDTGLVSGIRKAIHKENMSFQGLCYSDRGFVYFNQTTQICCNGVFNKIFTSDECCNGEIIDTKESFCCNGQIYNYKRTGSYKCCGSFTYNETTHICCNGHLSPRPQGPACCGDDVYNQQEHNTYVRSFCQGYSCCGSEVIHSSTHFCYEDRVHVLHGNQEKAHNGQTLTEKQGIVPDPCMPYENLQFHSTESNNDSTYTTEINQLPDENYTTVSSNTITIVCLTVVCVIITAVVIFVYCKTRRTKVQSVKVLRQATRFQTYNTIPDTQIPIPDVTEIPAEDNGVGFEHPEDIFQSKINVASSFHKMKGESTKNVRTSTMCTQTYPEKACNLRNIFGDLFEYNFILSSMSGATAKMPSSDVRLILPQTFLKQKRVEVNCTSFRSLFKLREKLGLSEEKCIASPVVEYALHGVEHLPDYAAVIMPFTGSAADLQVRKFHSDGGMSYVVMSVDVPLQGNSNPDLDTFYTVEDSNVRIFSKSVAGFYCTTCRHRPLRLRCLLFGSYKRFTNPIRHEVCAVVYLANDDVMKFEDYKETLTAKETAEGRVLKEERELTIPDDLTEDDIIQTSVTPINVHYTQWIHDHCLEEATPVHEKIQTISLGRLADRCKDCQHYHPCIFDTLFRMEWFLKNPEGVPQFLNYSFVGNVDVDIVQNGNGRHTPNRFHLELEDYP